MVWTLIRKNSIVFNVTERRYLNSVFWKQYTNQSECLYILRALFPSASTVKYLKPVKPWDCSHVRTDVIAWNQHSRSAILDANQPSASCNSRGKWFDSMHEFLCCLCCPLLGCNAMRLLRLRFFSYFALTPSLESTLPSYLTNTSPSTAAGREDQKKKKKHFVGKLLRSGTRNQTRIKVLTWCLKPLLPEALRGLDGQQCLL